MEVESRAERNVLVTHQFVTGASRSDSEEISVGGSDNVDAAVFKEFDYVALGHIHGPQNVGVRPGAGDCDADGPELLEGSGAGGMSGNPRTLPRSATAEPR